MKCPNCENAIDDKAISCEWCEINLQTFEAEQKAEAIRLAKEKEEALRKAEEMRLAKEKEEAEQRRLAKEKEEELRKAEAVKLAKEREEAEQRRLTREKEEKEKAEKRAEEVEFVREEIEQQDYVNATTIEPIPTSSKKQLTRSTTNRKIFGICGGLGEYYNVSPTTIRIIFCFATFFYGIGVVVYLVQLLRIPENKMPSR